MRPTVAIGQGEGRTNAQSPLLREVASGVDALYLSGRAAISKAAFEELLRLKGVASEARSSVPCAVGGGEFLVGPSGRRRYPVLLEHSNGPVAVTDSDKLPTFWIQPRAEFIHAVGAEAVVSWYEERLAELGANLVLSVSRVDLHADWQGWALTGDDRHRFVCRATERDTFEQSEALSGFVFGRKKSQTLLARIYDKTLEVEQTGHDWWYDIWGERREEGRPVIRVEFQFSREALRSFELKAPAEVLDASADLWRYATHEWLTFRRPTGDLTKSRWPLADEWRCVQACSLAASVLGLARIRGGATRGSLRRLLPGLNGYLVSFAAHTGSADLVEVLKRLPHYVSYYEEISGRTFTARVAERAAELGAA